MKKLTMEMPEDVFAAMRNAPEDFSRELRLAAAATWYAQGRISQEIAAAIAGVDRHDFLMALPRLGVQAFVVDPRDLDRQLARG